MFDKYILLKEALFDTRYAFTHIGKGIVYHGVGVVKGNLGLGKVIDRYEGIWRENLNDATYGDGLIGAVLGSAKGPEGALVGLVLGMGLGAINSRFVAPFVHDTALKWVYERKLCRKLDWTDFYEIREKEGHVIME